MVISVVLPKCDAMDSNTEMLTATDIAMRPDGWPAPTALSREIVDDAPETAAMR
jgi:hypothetical protein